MKLSKLFLSLLFISLLIINGCKKNGNSELKSDALLLEFNLAELPETVFSIDQSNGIVRVIKPENLDSELNLSSLTANFELSDGATISANDIAQVSGKTINDFSNGVFYTVSSEDRQQQKTYFVYLSKEVPLQFLLTIPPSIEINGNDISPLTAEVRFESREPTTASIEVLGDITVSHSFENPALNHELPILGLYADTENKIVLKIENSNNFSVQDTLHIQTGSLPEFLPTPEINVLKEQQMEPGMHFSEVHIGNAGVFDTYPIIFDNNGDIRWLMNLSNSGSINWPIQFNDDNTFFFTQYKNIWEYDMLGNLKKQIQMDGFAGHHEVIKIPNGNYIVAVNKFGATMIKNEEEVSSIEDYIVEINPSGNIVNEWDIAEVLDVNRTDLTDGDSDWFHMNAIWHDDRDNSLIISGRNQGLIKVNWENELQWIMAPHKGWGKAGRYEKTTETTPYLLTAIDATGTAYSKSVQLGDTELTDFSWAWGQHAPMVLPNGNLFVFDNGYNRNFEGYGSYSLATEYEIDEENMTVKEVWSYGRNRGNALFSNIISDVDYLPETGNRLFMPGIIRSSGEPHSKIVEVTYPNKEVVFESSLYFKNQLVDGQGWGNQDISYRSERVFLYR